MTCKDCIHYDACKSWINEVLQEYRIGETVCEDFKDKSRFVELPCTVGDTIYIVDNYTRWKIREEKVKDIIHYYGTDFMIFSSNQIGDRVFLTKEEAEKKLEEMKNER